MSVDTTSKDFTYAPTTCHGEKKKTITFKVAKPAGADFEVTFKTGSPLDNKKPTHKNPAGTVLDSANGQYHYFVTITVNGTAYPDDGQCPTIIIQ